MGRTGWVRAAVELLYQQPQMVGSSTAAAAHHADVVLLDELDQSRRKRSRLERVYGFTIYIQG
jgi:hypothetical protein